MQLKVHVSYTNRSLSHNLMLNVTVAVFNLPLIYVPHSPLPFFLSSVQRPRILRRPQESFATHAYAAFTPPISTPSFSSNKALFIGISRV